MKDIFKLAIPLLLLASPVEAKTVLTSSLILYFNPSTGNDTTGTGTTSAPFKTPCGAWPYLVASYDLNGFNATIQQQVTGAFQCNLSASGIVTGQNDTPQQVTIQGTSSSDPDNVMPFEWDSAPTGHSNTQLTVSLGARIAVTGFKFDNTYAITHGAGQAEAGIMINEGDGGSVWIGTVAFGFNGGVAYINTQVNTYGLIYGNLSICPPQTTATAATLNTTTSTATLSGVSGPPILSGAGVAGAGIVAGTVVSSYSAGVVTFNQPPSVNGTAVALTFSDSVATGIGVGEFSYLTNASNGYVTIMGTPVMRAGLLYTDNVGVMNWAYIPVFEHETMQKLTGSGTPASSQITLSSTAGFSTGSHWVAFSYGNLPFNTYVVSIDDATHVTLNHPPSVSFTNQPIKIGFAPASITGPQLSAWMNSSMNLGGSLFMLPGTAPTYGGPNALGSVSTGSQAQ